MPENERLASLPPPRLHLDVLLDRALQTGGETDGFDFKEQLDFQKNGEHKIRLLKAIGAFGNTDNGGHIIIGVSDDRKIVGLSSELAATYDQSPVQRMVGIYFAPPPLVQVRQHERDGKKLVVIEVTPFRDFPSIVKKHEVQGKEKLVDGTFLVRNSAAESTVLTSEAEVRKLCEAIAARRARAIVELIQRGTVGLSSASQPSKQADHFKSLKVVRERAETYWSSAPGAPPYLETYFVPERPLGLRGATLKDVFPSSAVPSRNGFPFHVVNNTTVETPTGWGWLGVIPFYEQPHAEHHPTYLWLLDRSGTFLYREHLWEDESQHFRQAIGIVHVLGELVLVTRFLDRLAARLDLAEETRFRVGIAINNIGGRYITNEKMGFVDEYVGTTEPRVEAFLDVTLGQLREGREDLVINLAEEIVWQFRRQDWSRQDLVTMLRRLPQQLGQEHGFPDKEA